jgi:Domain of unknown function (DUF4160)
MHVDRESRSTKFWLDPDVTLATNHGYRRREFRDIERIIRAPLETLRHAWDAFCSGDTSSA